MAMSQALAFAADIDAGHFREVLGLFATGVVAVAVIDEETGAPAGLSANSFTAVSLDPPLVSVCVAHTSSTWPRIRTAGRFAISILAEHQRAACLRLSTPGGDKFRGLAWAPSPAGHPVLDGALGWLDCVLEAEHWAGDHTLAICRVDALDIRCEGRPLIFYRGGYGGFAGLRG